MSLRQLPGSAQYENVSRVEIRRCTVQSKIDPQRARYGIRKGVSGNYAGAGVDAPAPGIRTLHLKTMAHSFCDPCFEGVVVRVTAPVEKSYCSRLRVYGGPAPDL